MKAISLKKILIYFLLIIVIFFLDRISKYHILNIAERDGLVDIFINNYLNIILVWNSGIGFGLLSFENDFIYNLITSLIVIINIIICYFVVTSKDLRGYFFAMILGGSLGNLFDRLYYSAVPDFIDLNYNNIHWFVFNIADIFITIGIFCLIFVELFYDKKKLQNE